VERLLRLSQLPATGRGVRVAVIDSGVHAAHPHVQAIAEGIAIDTDGREHADYTDRLGHGTAVTAAIREKAPDAELLAIKVFDRELATTAAALVGAIDWALRQRAHVINLSLGTANQEHEAALTRAVERANAASVAIVTAAPQPGARWLPGAIAGVIRVELDWTMPRDACRVDVADAHIRITASGYPRPIPGVPAERNLKGASFAVANATGLLARVLEGQTDRGGDYVAKAIAGVLAGVKGTTPSS
jgi:subtilisin family serine protease